MGAHVGDRPIDGSYVAIGWEKMGDLTRIAPNREAFKAALAEAYPDKKAGVIPVDAGSMFKFLHEIKSGDIVVYPSKSDRMVNIGRFRETVEYVTDDRDEYPTHRHVDWLGHFPRAAVDLKTEGTVVQNADKNVEPAAKNGQAEI